MLLSTESAFCVMAIAAVGLVTVASAAYQFKEAPTEAKIEAYAKAAVKSRLSNNVKWKYVPGTARFAICSPRTATSSDPKLKQIQLTVGHFVRGSLMLTILPFTGFAFFYPAARDEVMSKFETTAGDCQKPPQDLKECAELYQKIGAAIFEATCEKIEGFDKPNETPAISVDEKKVVDKVIATGALQEI